MSTACIVSLSGAGRALTRLEMPTPREVNTNSGTNRFPSYCFRPRRRAVTNAAYRGVSLNQLLITEDARSFLSPPSGGVIRPYLALPRSLLEAEALDAWRVPRRS